MSGFRNPFKQLHGSKRNAITKTEEREFDREVKKLEQLEEDAKKIYKDTKRCIECQTAQTKFENRLVQNLFNSGLCRDDPTLRPMTDAWFQTSQQLDLLSQELNVTSSKTVAESMKKFGMIFPGFQQAIKKREQALQEFNKTQMRVDKYMERDRTGQNIVKLEASRKEHVKTKAEFNAQNAPLVEDMPRLYDGRIDYFTPSFKSLIMSQLKYLTECHKCYTLLASTISPTLASQPDFASPFDDVTNDDDDDRESDSETPLEKPEDVKLQQVLGEIRALSITVDD